MWSKTLFLFPSLCYSLFAASISGVVQDPQHRPISDASVMLSPRGSAQSQATITNKQGEFRFTVTGLGEYILRAQANGFAEYVQPVSTTGNATVAVALSIAGLRQQVIVTASGGAQTSEEVSRSITVIDKDDLQTRDVPNVFRAVEMAPGVRVQQLGGPGQLASIRIRGLRAQDTAVLVDGLRLRDAGAIQADASGLIQDLGLANVSRMEVMNGAGSLLYGTTATGGVVNVLTDQGGGRTRGSVLAEGGSLASFRGRAQLAGSAGDRTDYSLGLTHSNIVRGVDGDDPFRHSGLQASWGVRVIPALRLSARLWLGDSFSKLNSSPTISNSVVVAGANDSDSRRAARFWNGAMRAEGQVSPKLTYAVYFQVLDSTRGYNNGPAGGGFQPLSNNTYHYDGRIVTTGAKLSYQWLPSQLLSAGYEFENETFGYGFRAAGPESTIDAGQKQNAFFIQDQAHFLDGRLQVSGGFRAQYFSLNAPVFTPLADSPYRGISPVTPPAAYTGDGSVAYWVRRSNTKIRAHVGQGYRAPSLYERFGAGWDSFFGYSTYGDPRLQPERSIGFDVGLEQNFAQQRARVSATYFENRLHRVITFADSISADPFGRFFGYATAEDGARSRGLEISGSAAPVRGVNITASYTFVDATEPPSGGKVFRVFVIPRHQVNAFATWRANSRLNLGFDTLNSSGYISPVFAGFSSVNYTFNGLRRMNASASYRLPLTENSALRFQVRGENLSGQNYLENGFRTPGRTAMGGIVYEF